MHESQSQTSHSVKHFTRSHFGVKPLGLDASSNQPGSDATGSDIPQIRLRLPFLSVGSDASIRLRCHLLVKSRAMCQNQYITFIP